MSKRMKVLFGAALMIVCSILAARRIQPVKTAAVPQATRMELKCDGPVDCTDWCARCPQWVYTDNDYTKCTLLYCDASWPKCTYSCGPNF